MTSRSRSNVSSPTKPITTRQATIEMIFAGAIWGFGFVATIFALESFGPLWVTAIRFAIAVVVSLPFVIWGRYKLTREKIRHDLRISFLPGIFVALTLILQTWGLKYTTATKCSFITSLYVVFVPLLEVVFFRRKFHRLHGVAILGGLLGMGLMSGLTAGDWNRGDSLTFLCAMTAAVHIVLISHIGERLESTFRFNTFQSFWCGLVGVTVALAFEPMGTRPLTDRAMIGLLSLAIASTAIAFFLQVRAQKVLSASTASLLFLLEAPFATLFAYFLLKEHATGYQLFGGVLILASAAIALRADSLTRKLSHAA